MMEGRGVKGHESISAYVHTVLPNCPSVSLNRRGRVAGGGDGDIPFVACVTSDRDISALEGQRGCVRAHTRASGVGECSRCPAVPDFTTSGVFATLGEVQKGLSVQKEGFAPHRARPAPQRQRGRRKEQIFFRRPIRSPLGLSVAVLRPRLVTT